MATDMDDHALTGARPIPGAPFGWEVRVHLGAPLDAPTREALTRIWQRDGLILFRGQQLDKARQMDACEIFGPVQRDAIDNFIVSNVVAGGLLGNAELLFHNDIPYVPAPYIGGSLYAIDVASQGAPPTRFASALRAWDRLPPALQQRLEQLKALQVRGRMLGRRTTLADLEPEDPCCVHPVMGRQQGTGRPYLFVNMDMTAQFTSLDLAESDALLEELFGYLYAPGEIYEHHWQPGDLIVWDNLAVQHARSAFGEAPRTLQRVSLARLGYWEQVPNDLPVFRAMQEM
jgi:taurine dioxygenase